MAFAGEGAQDPAGGSKKMIQFDDTTHRELRIYDHGVERKPDQLKYSCLVDYRTGDIVIPKLPRWKPSEAGRARAPSISGSAATHIGGDAGNGSCAWWKRPEIDGGGADCGGARMTANGKHAHRMAAILAGALSTPWWGTGPAIQAEMDRDLEGAKGSLFAPRRRHPQNRFKARKDTATRRVCGTWASRLASRTGEVYASSNSAMCTITILRTIGRS